MASNQLDANKTGWVENFASQFKDFDHFKAWYDPMYKGAKADDIWKKLGGKIEKKETKKAAE